MCLYTAQIGYGFQLLLQVVLLGMGKTLLSFAIPLYFYNLSGNVQQTDIRFGVGLLLRVIIHKLPSKKVCRLSVVRFLTSEYANPVNTENRNRSLTSSWVLSGISVFIMVCISFRDIPLSTLSGELIYPAKGLNGRRPSFPLWK